MTIETKVPSYAEGKQELRQSLSSQLPEEARQTFDSDAERLQETYQTVLKKQEGDQSPEFSLTDATGNPVQLSDLLKKGRVILAFYRGTWCPYCNLQLNTYQKALPEFQQQGAQLVAVSPQVPDESLSMKEKNELEFDVLSDPKNNVAKQFVSVFKNNDLTVETMNQLGIDFDAYYPDDSRELPVPAVFIIEQDGTISFAKSNGGDYRNRVEPSEILEALRS